MKQFFQWIGKQVATSLITAIFFILAVLGTVYAINYPSAPPIGEVAGGKFMNYFNTIFGQLTFTPTKIVVNPDICIQSGACLSTTAQKTDISGAPVLYNLSSHWEGTSDQNVKDQWRAYFVAGCNIILPPLGQSTAGCSTSSDGDIDAVIGYTYQPAILRAIVYLIAGGAPNNFVPHGCLSAPNIVRCTQGYACSYTTYHPNIPAFFVVSCIGTPTP